MTIDDSLPTAADLFGADLDGPPSAPTARPRAWFLGEAPAPEEEPSEEAGRIAMAAQAAQLPFLRVVHHLLEFVGDGCRTTKPGALYAVDQRRITERCRDHSDGWAWYPYGTDSRVQLAWEVLTRRGWLAREDGWVRPTGKPLAGAGSDALAGGGIDEEALEGARELLVAVLESACPDRPHFSSTERTEGDIWDALLVASGPEGLLLPPHPREGTLVHCFESVDFLVGLLRHPYVRDVPLDRASGHVADSALRRLALTAETLGRLIGCGVVTYGSGEGVDAQDEYWDESWDESWDERWDEYGYADDAPGRRPVRTYRTAALMRGAIAVVRASRGD